RVGKEVFRDNVELIIRGDFRREILGRMDLPIVGYRRWDNFTLELLEQAGNRQRSAVCSLDDEAPETDAHQSNANHDDTSLDKGASSEGLFGFLCFVSTLCSHR